jgi:hypothetical protein
MIYTNATRAFFFPSGLIGKSVSFSRSGIKIRGKILDTYMTHDADSAAFPAAIVVSEGGYLFDLRFEDIKLDLPETL